MIVKDLGNHVQLVEKENGSLFFNKIFVSRLSIKELEKYHENFMNYVENTLDPNMIKAEGLYDFEEIINYTPICNAQLLFNDNDDVKYPMFILSMPLDGVKDDLKLRMLQYIKINIKDTKVLQDYKLEVIYKYFEQFMGEKLEDFK